MSINRKDILVLNELLLRMLDGSISTWEFEHLQKLLMSNSALLICYMSLIKMCSTLNAFGKENISDVFQKSLSDEFGDLATLHELAEEEEKAIAIHEHRAKKLSEVERRKLIQTFIDQEERRIEEEKTLKEEEARAKMQQLRRIRMKQIRRRERILKLQKAAKRTWKYTKITSVAVVLAILVYVRYLLMQPVPVATLTDTSDARWDNPAFSGKLGERLMPGKMKLNSGLAQIIFDDGVEIILKAPAKIDLKESNRAFLRLGKLSAKVPQQAQGFTVDTPSAAMIDLGTEFGVEVKEDGTSDFHVFKGKVELAAASKGRRGKSSQVVKAGSAKRVKTDSKKILDIPFNDREFARTLHPVPVELVEPVEVIKPLEFIRSDETRYLSPYVKAIKQTGPVAYWPFSQDSKQIGNKLYYVNNAEIKAIRPVPRHGKRDNALKLNGKNSHVWTRDRAGNWAQNGFSLVLWIRPDSSARQNIILNAELDDPYSNYSRQLFINKEGKFAFWILVKEPDIPDVLYPLTLASSTLAQPGIWHHVAVTVDPVNGISMFVDGAEENNLSLDNQVFDFKPKERNHIYIGSSACGRYDDREPMNSFTGGLDEIARYNRALAPQEIKMIYNSVKYNKN